MGGSGGFVGAGQWWQQGNWAGQDGAAGRLVEVVNGWGTTISSECSSGMRMLGLEAGTS